MNIAAVLPHVEVFGGVRRYLEMGNALVKRGHRFVLFTPDGLPPDWLDYVGESAAFKAIGREIFDAAFCSECSMLDAFDRLRAARKFFYFVLAGHKLERRVLSRGYTFLGNSEGICRRIRRKYGVTCLKAAGCVNPDIFHPGEGERAKAEFHVLCYGRIMKRRKGVAQVIKAVEGLHKKHPRLKLIMFDSRVGRERIDPRPLIRTRVPHDFHLDLPQSRMSWLYGQADVFVSAERRSGWSNTTAEAMSCRIPVICTRSGTWDFAEHERTALVVPAPLPILLRRQIERLIQDAGLRRRLAENGYERIRHFSCEALGERLEELCRKTVKLK